VTAFEDDPHGRAPVAPTSMKIVKLRYDDHCRCGRDLPAGTRAGWDRAAKEAICGDCLTNTTSALEQASSPVTAPEVASDGPPDSTPDPPTIHAGTPGASLHREYERRVAKRDQEVRTKHPRLGGIILAITDQPQTTTAFKSGGIGEERAAARIIQLCGPSVLFLFNRLLGVGRRDGDIDLIAVTAGGVHVIDVKRYKAAKVEVRRGGGLFGPATERLVIDGRDRTERLESLARQHDAVRAALASHPDGDDVAVVTSLCFVDADLPVFGTLRIGGIALMGPRRTAKALNAATGSCDEVARASLHSHLALALPPAS
jgi:hypothetical protein